MSNQNNEKSQASSSSQPQPPTQPKRTIFTQPDNEPPKAPSANRATDAHVKTVADCDEIVNKYRRGEITKAFTYASIQRRIFETHGITPANAEAGFQSFINAVESHDAEVSLAKKRGKQSEDRKRSITPETDTGYEYDDEQDRVKKPKVDESEFPWAKPGSLDETKLSPSLAKTLELLQLFSVDPKATKRSLTNSPDCPEFPDTEWKNIIVGRAVNLDAVLSGQFSTSNNDVRTETLGDIEVSFGAVEPTKKVENGGDWTIAWNRTVRATAFAFPHRFDECASYGEYITSLFAATNPIFHSRIIAFDKAVRRRVGSVRNAELWDHERFADLKIAHIDSIGVSVGSGSSRGDSSRSKGQRKGLGKKNEPCNKWNEDRCDKTKEECRRQHVCNVCEKPGHKGKDCKHAK